MGDTGAVFEIVSSDSLVSAPLRGAAGAGFTGPVRAQFVGMSQAVCLFGCSTSLAFGADFEDVSGDSLVSALLRGAAGVVSRAPFAPSLWGCLRRFACSVAQHPSLSEQILRMSQAIRWLQHPQGGRQGGISWARSGPDCGDVSGGLPVLGPF